MRFEIETLDHIVLITQDIERSLQFYVDVLGCELIRKVTLPELYQLKAGDSLIDLKPGEYKPSEKNLDHFCLRIKPFEPDVLLPYLESVGIPCGKVEQRNGAKGFGSSVYIEDPDGNCIELKAT